MNEATSPQPLTLNQPFVQKKRTCDNSRCHNWHGGMTSDGTNPQFYAVLFPQADVDTTEGNQYTLGQYTYTVCSTCERACDNFFEMFRKSQQVKR